jgi:hypothetical protein
MHGSGLDRKGNTMKRQPIAILISNILVLINALIWLVLGGITAFNLHPALPNQTIIKWTLAILSFIAFAILLVLFVLLIKRNKIAYFLTLGFLVASSILIVFDDIGWIDIAVLVVNIAPIILLIIYRNWYLQRRNWKSGKDDSGKM